MNDSVQTQVLIIGAGPSGLAAAIELGLRGVDCRIVEPRTTIDTDRPRAKTTNARTMEHFRRWGLAEAIRSAAAIPVAWSQDVVFCTSLLGEEITRFNHCFGLTPDRTDLFPESGQQIPQPSVELLMREAVAELRSVKTLYGYHATSLTQADSHVEVQIRDARDGLYTIRAEYALGCDGPGGISREAIGARYLGSSDVRRNTNIVFSAPGLAERVPHGPAVHYWVINNVTPGALGRLDLRNRWTAVIPGIDDTTARDELLKLLRDLVGGDLDAEIISTDTWSARMLLADRFAHERVFLVGDAAHLNPPWGGHGFNIGVGDAVNIGWKLAAVLEGWGGPQLLASYEPERRGVATETIEVAARHLRRTSADLANAQPAALDDTPDSVRTALARNIHETKDCEFHSLGLVLGYHYADSPIVAREPGPADEIDVTTYVPTARAGARLPHAWLADGSSLYDQIGSGHTLIRTDPATDARALVAEATKRGAPLRTVTIPRSQLRTDLEAPFLLVRPDQHIAWRGAVCDIEPARLLDLIAGHERAPQGAA